MKRPFAHRALAGLAFTLLALSGCKKPSGDTAADAAASTPITPSLIPAPAELKTGEGSFVISVDTRLSASSEAATRVAQQFADYLQSAGGPALATTQDDGKGTIRFVLDAAAADGKNPEGYTLDVTPDGVTVKARDERGLFYGAVTLWQLVTQGDAGRVTLPALHIEDAPRFTWRGFMLDPARHFQQVDEVKKIIDAMALHKLNTLHWHLTDDQGWRIEIKQYPKLTEVGGCRIPAGDGGKDPKTGEPRPYCGFYTQDQIRDVVKYAAERHITVVPEINVPGHATAAISAYPELGSIDTPLVPSNEWGVFPNLVNVEEPTITFLENVLGEVVTLFPGTYVHIGGDEAVKDQWEASAREQARMRQVGAKTEMDLQGYLVERLEKYLSTHGKRLIGWDEILEAKLPPEATVMSWRGIEGGLQAARQGHDVVMSPSNKTYLDYLQTASPNEPPGRPALITLQDVYGFDPVPPELEASQRHHILGIQANLWTEHTRTFARLQHNAFPRLAAVAETGWTPAAKKDFASFTARLPAQLKRYDAIGLGYAKTPFEPLIATENDRKAGTAKVTLSNPLDYPVHYTTDGSEPTPASPAFRTPLDVKLPATVRAAAFADGRALAPASTFELTPASMLTRTDEAMSVCPDAGRLLLRLEDDGPLEGERAIFNTTIFYPCWQWNQADLDGIGSIKVRAGRIPYYFQLAHDEPARTFEPAKSPLGELEILGGGCKGHLLATVPLPAAPNADGFLDLEASLPAGTTGRQDLCVRFTGDTRPQMWVLDRITLQPR